jgi:uncharacterized protein DUF4388/uncharacterized protein DUF4339
MTTSWWFYVRDDKRMGPVDIDQLLHLVVTAELAPQTLVWRHGLPEWTEVGRVAEVASRLPPPVPPAPGAPVSPRVEELRRRLERDPGPTAFALVAEELRRDGEYEECVRVCREGLQRYSPYPSLQLTLGRALFEDGDPVMAHAELEAVLRAAPDNIVAGRLLEQCRQALVGSVGAPAPNPGPGPGPESVAAGLEDIEFPEVPPEPPRTAPPIPPPVRVAAPAPEPAPTPRPAAIPLEPLEPSGRLADRDFADLIHQVHERRWTGLITLNHMGVEKSVRVEDGQLVFASSSSRDDRLGEVLLRHGKITLDQHVAASAAVGKNKRLGTALVEQGALDPREMVKVVVDQTQEIIYSLFLWTEGLYHMTEDADSVIEPITLKLVTPHVIIKGITRVEAWSRIERAIGGAQAVYARADDWESMLSQMTLSAGRLALLSQMAGPQDVGTICRGSTLPHFEVCQLIWAFRVVGLLKRVG